MKWLNVGKPKNHRGASISVRCPGAGLCLVWRGQGWRILLSGLVLSHRGTAEQAGAEQCARRSAVTFACCKAMWNDITLTSRPGDVLHGDCKEGKKCQVLLIALNNIECTPSKEERAKRVWNRRHRAQRPTIKISAASLCDLFSENFQQIYIFNKLIDYLFLQLDQIFNRNATIFRLMMSLGISAYSAVCGQRKRHLVLTEL